MEDPVMFMEHKGLYRQGYAASPEPDKNFLLPFGKAAIVQEGDDLTIVTWGALVQKTLEAVQNTGISAEIIAQINEKAILDLEAPVERVTGFDTVMPLYKNEMNYLPSESRINKAIEKVMNS